MLGWQQREAGAARVASEAAGGQHGLRWWLRKADTGGVGRSAQAMAGRPPPPTMWEVDAATPQRPAWRRQECW